MAVAAACCCVLLANLIVLSSNGKAETTFEGHHRTEGVAEKDIPELQKHSKRSDHLPRVESDIAAQECKIKYIDGKVQNAHALATLFLFCIEFCFPAPASLDVSRLRPK